MPRTHQEELTIRHCYTSIQVKSRTNISFEKKREREFNRKEVQLKECRSKAIKILCKLIYNHYVNNFQLFSQYSYSQILGEKYGRNKTAHTEVANCSKILNYMNFALFTGQITYFWRILAWKNDESCHGRMVNSVVLTKLLGRNNLRQWTMTFYNDFIISLLLLTLSMIINISSMELYYLLLINELWSRIIITNIIKSSLYHWNSNNNHNFNDNMKLSYFLYYDYVLL